MQKDTSFGIIPLRRVGPTFEVLLVHHKAGHWAFPKGHADTPDETPHQAAERELREETGLLIDAWVDHAPLHENYTFTHDGVEYDKTVTYFVAIVHGIISLQVEEVINAQWMPLSEAANVITFPEGRALLGKIQLPD